MYVCECVCVNYVLPRAAAAVSLLETHTHRSHITSQPKTISVTPHKYVSGGQRTTFKATGLLSVRYRMRHSTVRIVVGTVYVVCISKVRVSTCRYR